MCPVGKATPVAATANACPDCARGKFVPSQGAAVCGDCPQSTYNPSQGSSSSSACLSCPANHFSAAASDEDTDCLCEEGWTGEYCETTVKACPDQCNEHAGQGECKEDACVCAEGVRERECV